MSHRVWLATALLLLGVLFGAVSCHSDDGALTEAEAQEVAEDFFRSLFNAISGREPLETVLSYYPPECGAEITQREIDEAKDTLAVMRLRTPSYREIDIDEFLLVDPRFEPDPKGLLVFLNQARIIAEGVEWDADGYFIKKGIYEEGDGDFGEGRVLVIKREGKVYVDLSECVADLFRSS